MSRPLAEFWRNAKTGLQECQSIRGGYKLHSLEDAALIESSRRALKESRELLRRLRKMPTTDS